MLLLAGILLYSQTAAPPDKWAPLRFLLGEWEGTSEGQPGKGTSRREYRLALKDQFIEVRNRSVYQPQPKNPKGETHEDWGMISFDRARKRFVLRQFHVEGFVNQYVAGEHGLVFESESIENIPAGFRARETYTVTGPDSFTERFELAAPGKEFEVYSETRFKRQK
jgi:hypothetical protein